MPAFAQTSVMTPNCLRQRHPRVVGHWRLDERVHSPRGGRRAAWECPWGSIDSPTSGSKRPRCSACDPPATSRWRTSTMPAASPLCWRYWSRCWTATASWAMGGRWPRSLPASAPRSHGPIPACARSTIRSCPTVGSSCCVGRLLRGAPSSSGRRHRASSGPTAVLPSCSTSTLRTQRAADPGLHASPDSVIVLRNAGIVGAPGMPEIDFVPIPAVLRKAGITELVCVTDGRMSGTEGGPTALHVTPEAAVGGPIGLVRDGDEIVLDAIDRHTRSAGRRTRTGSSGRRSPTQRSDTPSRL